jgi:hypothetical protein
VLLEQVLGALVGEPAAAGLRAEVGGRDRGTGTPVCEEERTADAVGDELRQQPGGAGAKPPPAGHPRTADHLGGQLVPGDPGLEHEHDPGQHHPILDRLATGEPVPPRRMRRQQRRHPLPQRVRNKITHHGGQRGRARRQSTADTPRSFWNELLLHACAVRVLATPVCAFVPSTARATSARAARAKRSAMLLVCQPTSI